MASQGPHGGHGQGHWQPQPGQPQYGQPGQGYGSPGPGYGAPPAYGASHNHMMYDAQKKSVGASYVLWFFLGMLGAHRFYLGQSGTGAAMLVLFLVAFVLTFVLVGILLMIPLWIWWIVDAFLIPGMASEYNMRLARQFSGGY